ncbi:MAG: TlpA disulfide reductase family protein [Candidatus Acidiferrales bacterium]|jgi:peroxiredoxin
MSLKRRLREAFGGEKMETLTPGKTAPPISLKTLAGGTATLADALKKGPVVAAFFKVSCPTCQFSAPFLERIHETYAGEKFTLWGISQDDAEDTREFCKEFDVDFPILLEAPGYALSNKYGLTHVPSVFLISPDGKIQETSIGFSKDEFERIAAAAAQATGAKPSPLFKPSEHVPAVKPG